VRRTLGWGFKACIISGLIGRSMESLVGSGAVVRGGAFDAADESRLGSKRRQAGVPVLRRPENSAVSLVSD
jgi:hypothetical protein